MIRDFNDWWISEAESYKYGCVMAIVRFPSESLQELLEEDDLTDTGKDLEDEPHITLLYGIHSDEVTPEEVMGRVDMDLLGKVKLHNASLFESSEYDVLKLDAEGEGLHRNNSFLTRLPHTTKFPDYHPHLTIAYLKPGTGKKYVEKMKGREYEVEVTGVTYSMPGEESVTVFKG